MNRTVLITGVSSGFGLGLAKAYLESGCRVLGTSRREPEELNQNADFHFHAADLRDASATTTAIKSLAAGCEVLDLAILNAGMLGEFGDLKETSLADIQDVMQVNVWSNKTVLDVLFNSGKPIQQVVTISSGASVNGNRGWNGYGLSKATLNMLTKLYAAEQPDTHFCAFAPGLVDTAMQDQLCGISDDDRYQSLEVLKSKRNTPEMPSGDAIASRMIAVFERLPELVESGSFADIRKLPE